ncbi:MAG: relaxase/mobilization nuclease domain-containing protein [Clostridia bacterium]|nr:relaxase/mobilization nuclease domain-containing protein [Clostridia bacterium]
MAITKIHTISSTLQKAVDYICNPLKTDERLLVSSYMCNPNTAQEDFMRCLKMNATGKGKTRSQQNFYKMLNGVKANHLIQSFLPGEITKEEAHEVGEELAKRLLGNKYQYVIATHVDKGHIHNHIIFCDVDMVEYKRYNKTYWNVRQLNDELCMERGLSVLDVNKINRRGKNYKEWRESNTGNSWKDKIRANIDFAIKNSSNYNSFLKIVKLKGCEVDDSGKWLKFKLSNGEHNRWCRAKSNILGNEYTREAIKERIRNRDTTKTINKFINTDLDKYSNNYYLKRWAKIQNLKNQSELLNKLTDRGYTSIYKAKARINELDELINANNALVNELENQNKILASIINANHIYNENLKYFKIYESAKNKEDVLQKYDKEIDDFIAAGELLLKYKVPFNYNVQDYINKLDNNNADIENYIKRIKPIIEERADLSKIVNELDLNMSGGHNKTTQKNKTENMDL